MEAKDRPRICNQRVAPPYSTRSLHHPSFMGLYSDPGRRRHGDVQTVHPMVLQEFFYTDRTMICGTRIPNHLNARRDFESFQLNTPPPIMSACVAPPNHSDPFRTGQYLSRNLGCSSWDGGLRPGDRMWMVIQMTQEEDQTITNLLKLHHGDGKLRSHGGRFSPAPHGNSDQANKQMYRYSREAELGKQWSDPEIEAANTLLTCFGATSHSCNVKSDWFDDVLLSDVRVLSTSEWEALCGLLNLGLEQT